MTGAELKREYLKTWKAEHKAKVKEYNRTYWERKALRINEENKQG